METQEKKPEVIQEGQKKKKQKKTNKRAQALSVVPAVQKVKENLKKELKSENKQAQKIARALSLPLHYPIPRWSSLFAGDETAIANPFSIGQFPANTWNDTTPSGDVISADTLFGVFTRNPSCASIVWVPQPSVATAMSYQFYGTTQNGLFQSNPPSTSFSLLPGTIATQPGDTLLPVNLVYALPTSAYQPHGDSILAGSDGKSNNRYFWMDRNTTFNATLTYATTGTLANVSMSLVQANLSGVSPPMLVTNSPTSPIAYSQTITSSGYYSLQVCFNFTTVGSITTATISSCSLSASTCPSIMAHRTLPKYFSKASSINANRISAVGALVSNTSADLYKQGKITMFQSPPGIHWSTYATGGDPQSRLAGLAGSATLPANNGMYGYLKMMGQADYQLTEYISAKDGVIYDSYWPILSREENLDQSYLVVAAKVNTYTGRDFLLSVAWGIEFTTSDFFYDLEMPPADDGPYHEAIVLLRDAPQFTENPLHISAIWKGIKDGAKNMLNGAIKYGPKLLEAASLIGKLI